MNRVRALAALPAVFLVASILLAVAVLFVVPRYAAVPIPVINPYPEVQELAGKQMDLVGYQTYFKKVAEAKGAVYAFQVLKRAHIAPNVDTHLIGHVIGDEMYKQKGKDAIKFCTPDFEYACSHESVIGYLLDHGPAGLPVIGETCRQAPGTKGAYSQCFHGLGHGVLAYNDYDLKKAVEMCKLTGTPEYGYREAVDCTGGAVMEMVAGIHDPEVWAEQKKVFFKDSDPLYPCDADWFPTESREICYVFLSPHLMNAAGGNLSMPAVYPKAMSFCDVLPIGTDRNACFGGFGKEFVGQVQGRDIRDLGNTPVDRLQQIRTWCKYAPDEEGEARCDSYALSSLFWAGENSPNASFNFCAMAEGNIQNRCYNQLSQQINYFLGPSSSVCKRLPENYQYACKQK